jgi:hypothetical protein
MKMIEHSGKYIAQEKLAWVIQWADPVMGVEPALHLLALMEGVKPPACEAARRHFTVSHVHAITNLLAAFPEYRERMDEWKQLGEAWEKLAARWEEVQAQRASEREAYCPKLCALLERIAREPLPEPSVTLVPGNCSTVWTTFDGYFVVGAPTILNNNVTHQFGARVYTPERGMRVRAGEYNDDSWATTLYAATIAGLREQVQAWIARDRRWRRSQAR